MSEVVTTEVEWHKWPLDRPNQLIWGQYKRYIVARRNGHVFECSWLNGGWHERHDGCSDVTDQIAWWCEKPTAPK